MIPDRFTVRHVKQELADTWTIELESLVDRRAFPFTPGTFNMVYAFGAGEIPLSVSGDPAHPERLVHTVRSVGAVSRKLCELTVGEEVGVRGPFGTSWPLEPAEGKNLLLIAGGLGLAPLRPVVYRALSERKKFNRVILLYGARTPQDILYGDELAAWQKNGELEIEMKITVDRAGPDWKGDVGVVTTRIAGTGLNPPDTAAFICGPEIMMRFTVRELASHGHSLENIWISMERNMKCAIGFCGHCMFGPKFICKDGPVFRYDEIKPFFESREI